MKYKFGGKPFRKIARKGHWQARYRISREHGSPIFEEPLVEWSIDKIEFVEWLKFYHNIMSLPADKKPPDHILENDFVLDQWLEKMAEDLKSGKKQSQEEIHYHDEDAVMPE